MAPFAAAPLMTDPFRGGGGGRRGGGGGGSRKASKGARNEQQLRSQAGQNTSGRNGQLPNVRYYKSPEYKRSFIEDILKIMDGTVDFHTCRNVLQPIFSACLESALRMTWYYSPWNLRRISGNNEHN